ncbi:iron(III) ABC transporter periplasmic iron-binding protein [gut metagenome]|uniref:Iron(III) ABC transporter periplasmic iron-binding protein n=1 Tax=gut metagenome TaxID=749906 RepID=J9FHT8_9ZZZZ
MNKLLILCLVLGALCCSCGNGRGDAPVSVSGDTLKVDYARLFTWVDYQDYQVASLRNPWDTLHILHTYILVPRDKELPSELPSGTVVRTPLQRSLVYSAVHSSLLHELGVGSAIGGVCDLKYICLDTIHAAVRAGRIVDCGDGMQPDLERIIELSPDAVLLSPFENSGGYGKIEKLNIPLIECADYMETSALGRAEWMRFYGRLFGVADEADSIFSQVKQRYEELCFKASLSSVHLSVFSERKSGSAWYMPGGNSTLAGLYRDACASYPFDYTTQSGSVPLAFETVFDKAGEADVWLIKYNSPRDLTYDDLRAEYVGYARFKAFKQRTVYGCNTSYIPYYEETPFHPDRLLEDFIQMFHPELGERMDGLRYFRKLK